jgi:hypothetical protein
MCGWRREIINQPRRELSVHKRAAENLAIGQTKVDIINVVTAECRGMLQPLVYPIKYPNSASEHQGHTNVLF